MVTKKSLDNLAAFEMDQVVTTNVLGGWSKSYGGGGASSSSRSGGGRKKRHGGGGSSSNGGGRKRRNKGHKHNSSGCGCICW